MRASVLIVDDDASIRRALADRFRFWGHSVTTAADGEEALTEVIRKSFDLILLDLSMPVTGGMAVLSRLQETGCDADVVVLTAYGSLEKAVEAMKLGADDFLSKPADFELLHKIVDRALEKRRLLRSNRVLVEQASERASFIVGPSPAVKELIATATRAASSDSTVLLMGESGTGKQVLAEHIHRESPRASGPFVYVNCVAISEELIESTLFGHEKGAFTGAVARKPGRLEGAGGGTAFLDEVGDISSNLQTKLLHFLEAGEFERVGGTQTVTVDCRIIAATNRDLAGEVQAERFREDLYYRLNVIALRLPPLRERPEDIPVLAQGFLQRLCLELKRAALEFTPETLKIMESYAWPGNVRQLRNAIERMAVLSPSNKLAPDLLPPEICAIPKSEPPDLMDMPYREAMAGFKHKLIERALWRAGGNQTKAAELLGIQRTYLNRVIKETGEKGQEHGAQQ
ncbi:sigma-54-dependent transcriptional regulator [Candidatus Eisenbacteria bacterium]|uniref:Sigma-54-dependent transcriptional regulator n=1 Tax=Eiseniibacteriota bacterium TaxID=2212470 RepID=A0ABV6YJY9_UNCEI